MMGRRRKEEWPADAMDEKETAAELGIKVETLRSYASRGKIKKWKRAGFRKPFYSRAELNEGGYSTG